MGYFATHIGIRGDVRYFRTLQDNSNDSLDFDLGGFHFWRASIGVVIK